MASREGSCRPCTEKPKINHTLKGPQTRKNVEPLARKYVESSRGTQIFIFLICLPAGLGHTELRIAGVSG